MEFFIILLAAVAVFGFKSFVVIPQQEVHVVERLGRFHRALTSRFEYFDSLYRPRRLPPFAERNPFRRTQPGLHHAR